MKFSQSFIKGYLIISLTILVLLLAGIIYLGVAVAQVNHRVEQTDCDAGYNTLANTVDSVNGLKCTENWLK